MEHSFNIEVAQDYNVEKAIILNNLYYWCTENKANERNIYKGKAYTYNTAEAYAELFPYFKPRKIAEILRQLEADELIESAQIHGTNRVKSYTLTDKALQYYISVHSNIQKSVCSNIQKSVCSNIQKSVQSNIQKSDNGTYKNETMEHTQMRQCTITNNKQQIINSDKGDKARTVKYLLSLSLDEQYKLVSEYANANALNFDVKYFVDWWTARDWIPKGRNKPLSDWQATARNWSKREASYNSGGGGNLWQKEAQMQTSCYDNLNYCIDENSTEEDIEKIFNRIAKNADN